ncbi:MAG: hypothetical protein R3E76_13475 [Planctomycetota bacterium]
MSLTCSTTDEPRPRTLREWAENLNRPATPREIVAALFAGIAGFLVVLLDFLGSILCISLWIGGETLAAKNQLLLLSGTSFCAVCALFSYGTVQRRNKLLIACLCASVLTGTATWMIHEFFVPEGPGWFGTYGKPLTLWAPAMVVMLTSTLATLVSRLLYLKPSRSEFRIEDSGIRQLT